MADRLDRLARYIVLPVLLLALLVLVLPASLLIVGGIAGAPLPPGLGHALGGTLLLGAGAATLAVPIALAVAASCRIVGPRAEAVVMTVSAIPLSLSALITAFAFLLLFGRSGVIPLLVARAGGDPRWLSDAFFGLPGLVLVYLHLLVPRALGVLMPVLAGLDLATFRVARVLRAGPLRATRDALWPQVAPAFLSAWSLCFAVGAGSYAAALVLLGTRAPLLPVLLVGQLNDAATDTGPAGAIVAVIVALCTAAALLMEIAARWLRRGSSKTRQAPRIMNEIGEIDMCERAQGPPANPDLRDGFQSCRALPDRHRIGR